MTQTLQNGQTLGQFFELLYFITIKNSQTLQPRWQLATNYAPAMLQCFREDLRGSVWNAACFLLSNGIPFNTFSRHVDLSPRAKNTRTYTPYSLGWHPTGHRPGPREYTVYEELRDRVLNRPYRHAALLQGGIVWHLALHALEFPTDAEISVTQGPSEDALTRGTIIGLDDGVELFDDTLTEEEIELICGVYKWSTGMCMCNVWVNDCILNFRRWGWTDSGPLLVAEAQCFLTFWFMAWILDTLVQRMVPDSTQRHSWAQGRTEDLSGME